MAQSPGWFCCLALLLLAVSQCAGQSTTDCSQQVAWTYSCPMNGQVYWLCEEGPVQWGCSADKPFASSQCTQQCTFNSTNPAYTPGNCSASVQDPCSNDQNYYTCTSSTAGGCLPQSAGWIPRCSQQCLLTTGLTPTTPSSPPPPPLALSPPPPSPPSAPPSPPPPFPSPPPPPPPPPSPSPSPPPPPPPPSPSPSPPPPSLPPSPPPSPPIFYPFPSAPPPPFPSDAPTFSCGLPVTWQGPNANNYDRTTNRPLVEDALFDFMTKVCNYLAAAQGTCCYLVDLYGDSSVVRTNNPSYIGKTLTYTLMPLSADDFKQTSDAPFTSIDKIEQLCNNVDGGVPTTCTLHHGMTLGTTTTTSHTWTVGGALTVSTKGGFNLLVANGELSVSVQVSFSWAQTESTTTTNTQTNDFTQSVPVPAHACYNLVMENVKSTSTAALTSKALIHGVAFMVFRDEITLPGIPTGNTFAVSPGQFLAAASGTGFTEWDPYYSSLFSNILTRTDYLSVDYYDAISYTKELDPKSPQCKVASSNTNTKK